MYQREHDQLRAKWLQTVLDQADDLVAQLEPFESAVPLRPLVNLCDADIVFEPLPVAGMTKLIQNRFRIFCDCAEEDVYKWESMYRDAQDLGRSLAPRARFTIAHEVVHTFFYERRASGYRNRLAPKTKEESRTLEKLCDMGANRLLLPRKKLRQRLELERLTDPKYLLDVSKEFSVSPQVLLIGIGSEKGLWQPSVPAGAYLIRGWSTSPVVESSVGNNATRRTIGDLKRGAKFQELGFSTPELILFGGRKLRAHCRLPRDPENRLCELRVQVIDRHQCLLTIRPEY